MEEIAWGQTLFHFATPEAWSALNHQGETTLHNLAERSTLNLSTQVTGTLFALGLIAVTTMVRRAPMTLLGLIAPPPSMLFLGLIAGGSVWLHPEMIELILSIFFFLYAIRIWFASRGHLAPTERSAELHRSLCQASADRIGDADDGITAHSGISGGLDAGRSGTEPGRLVFPRSI
jgi:hypothetical protein